MARQLYKHKTIRQALEHVARNPEWPSSSDGLDVRLEMRSWELVARQLYGIALQPRDGTTDAQRSRASRALRLIMERMDGTRRMGTNPATKTDKSVALHDLTSFEMPEVNEGETDVDGA